MSGERKRGEIGILVNTDIRSPQGRAKRRSLVRKFLDAAVQGVAVGRVRSFGKLLVKAVS